MLRSVGVGVGMGMGVIKVISGQQEVELATTGENMFEMFCSG